LDEYPPVESLLQDDITHNTNRRRKMTDSSILKEKCLPSHYERLACLKNEKLSNFVAMYAELCNPESIFVRTDSKEDAAYIRNKAIEAGEETQLQTEGHTVHFDGMHDQARDKENTRFLVAPGMSLGRGINSIPEKDGIKEINGLLKNIMAGKEMFVLFLCLGPVDSEFSIYAVQLTDSSYVAHSEDILFRPAYDIFSKKQENIEFFRYVHSAGELDGNVSKNVRERRVYVDLLEDTVYSVNTQYAGNTVGLKKLSLRLAIRKAGGEGWLAEHMFVMGVHGRDRRKSYFLGAFPSFCGKTSTCMVEGEKIVGDDIAYLRKREGKVCAVNVERGMFGIIKDVKEKSDPLIWEALTGKGEVIFSNVLVKDGMPRWQGDGRKEPDDGVNFSGNWVNGKKDEKGKKISLSHTNARYTARLENLENCDAELENPNGVEVKGIIYGGRDSNTWPPVFQSFDWAHGVVTIAASLESETTAATLGEAGIRKFNLMANLDFLSIPIAKYVGNHLDFASGLREEPIIFGVNYFLKGEDGQYLTGIEDKRVWLKWMELRVNKEVSAVKTPIGFLPEYDDLKILFREVLSKEYSKKDYLRCFELRVSENLAKIDRIRNIYRDVEDVPEILFEVLKAQEERIKNYELKEMSF
jgi:phosphoenolpyruvate carboxykinase (GTP)